MRNVRLHLRVLVLALSLMLIVPTLGRSGTDRVRPDATTAVAAAADPAPAAPAPKAQPSSDEGAAATAKATRDAKDAPAAAQSAPDATKGKAPAKPEAPARGKDEGKAAEAPAKGKAAAAAAPKGKAPTKGKDEAKAAPGMPAGKGSAGKGSRAAAAAAPAGQVRSLYLAIGHGRAGNGTWQPGAEHTGHGVFEVDAAAVMVQAMHEELATAPNLELHVESADDHPNVVGSVAAANALGVDDCIEVHQDTAAAPPGAFVHWYPGATAAKDLADRVIRHIEREGVGIRHDWHRPRPGLYMLRKSTCRSILVEVGRVGDFDTKKLQELGRAMARAYLRDTREVRGVAG